VPRLAQAELARTRVLAPSDGTVLQRYAEPGEMAGPASARPALLFADLSRYRVRAFVDELDASQVRVGQRVSVTADGLPGKELTGRVASVLPRMGLRSPRSDSASEYSDVHYREVLIDLASWDGLTLKLRVQTRIHTLDVAGR
jgi:multidrug resistance efflux pump